MKIWKWLGLAGIAGVAAGGAAIARRERQRASYTPEQIRDRLHQRYAEAQASDGSSPDGSSPDGSR